MWAAGIDRVRGVGLGEWLRRFFGVLTRRQTYLNLVYLWLAFPLGMAYFVAITIGVSMGVSLLFFVVGVFVLVLVLLLAVVLATFERWLTELLLDVEITSHSALPDGSLRERASALLRERATWTAVFYLPAKFVLGTLVILASVPALSTAIAMLTVPLYYQKPGVYVGLSPERAREFHPTLYLAWDHMLVGVETVISVGSWRVTSLPRALVVAALGVVVGLATLHLLNAAAWAWGQFARLLLAEGYDAGALFRRAENSAADGGEASAE